MNSRKIIPPSLARRFLRWFLREDLTEEVQGDLEEHFYDHLEKISPLRAKLKYWNQVLNYLRPFAIKNLRVLHFNNRAMINSYFKIGWRNLLKYWNYSTINLLGLSIGFGATILLLMIMNYESSFDRFHEHSKDLYRVATGWSGGGFSDLIVTPQIPLMKDEYPDIRGATRFFGGWGGILQYKDKGLLTSLHLVDADFTEMFNFRVLRGNLKAAFSTPDKIILTESYADKLIGAGEKLGETVSLAHTDQQFTIVAIVEDPPKNSSLLCDFIGNSNRLFSAAICQPVF
jgi:putative ABC transport system permease protein